MKVVVNVSLKEGVLDPQGKAVHHALGSLGFGGVSEVRVGKRIELELSDGTSKEDIVKMCETLLANTVIEDNVIETL